MKKVNNLILNQSIRVKLFISYLLIFLLPLILMGLISYNWLYRIIMDQTLESYGSRLTSVKESIDARFEELHNYAIQLTHTKWLRRIMINNDDVVKLDAVSLKNYDEELALYNIGNSFVDEISIYIHGKNLIISSIGNSSPEWFFEDAFRLKKMNLDAWSSILEEYNSHNILSSCEVTTYGRKRNGVVYIQSLSPYDYNDIRATLIAYIDRNTIEKLLRSAFNDSDTVVMVIDDTDKVIADLNAKEEFIYNSVLENISDIKPVQNIKIQNNNYFVFGGESQEVLWGYIVFVPVKSIMQEVKYVKWIMLSLIAVSIVIGSLLSYELALLNYRPLINLVDYISNRINFGKSHIATNEYSWLETAIDNVLREENVIRNRLEKHKPMLVNGYLSKMLEDDFHPNQEFIRALELIDIVFIHPLYNCMVISRKNVNGSFSEVIDDMLICAKDHNIICYSLNYNSSKVIICNYLKDKQFKEFIHSIETMLGNHERYITIGVGSSYEKVENLPCSYREALLAVDYRLIKEKGCIISFEEIVSKKDDYYYYPMDKEVCIANYLKAGDYNNAMKLFREIMEFNLSQKYLSINAIKYFFFNVELTAVKIIKEIGLEEVIDINFDEIINCDDIDDMKMHIEQIYYHICDVVQKQKQNQNTQLKDAIARYIDENYTNQLLSLSSISQHFSVSPSYFSRYFKEQFNCNFLEYINKKRIMEAQKLLKEGEMDIGDIARTVGYNNDVTFRRVFKKYSGMLPSSFRESL